MKLAGGIQGARSTLQTAIFSIIFVATGGNLTASYSASFVNQVVFSLLQRYRSERMRQRSAELAAELKDFNAQLRAIRDRQKQQEQIGSSPSAVDSDPLLSPTSRSGKSLEDVFPTVPQQESASGLRPAEMSMASMASSSTPAVKPSLSPAATHSVTSDEGLLGDGSDPKAASDQLSHALMALDLLLPETTKDKIGIKGN